MFLWVDERPHKQAVTGTARVGRCFGVRRGACASVCPSCEKVPDKSNLRRASLGSGALHHKESTVAGWLAGGCGCGSLLAHNVTGQRAEGRIQTLSCLPLFIQSRTPAMGWWPCGQSEFDFPDLPLWKHTQIQSSRLWPLLRPTPGELTDPWWVSSIHRARALAEAAGC